MPPGSSDAPTNSTAVDLSRLPPPIVVEPLSFEEIRGEMLADLAARDPGFDALIESDPAVRLIEVFAYRELVLRQRFNDRARGVMLAYARGADLDQLAALFGVTRLLITPADPQTGAAAVYEEDDALRARVVLAPESYSVAGPELAYVSHARGAHADVLDASAISPEPGEVLVTVLSRIGDGTASAELVAAVAAVVNSKPVRPLTDLVAVQGAEIVDFALEAQLFLYYGPDPEVVIAAAEASASAYLSEGRRLGRDVTLSGLYAALHVPGVQRVRLLSPTTDLLIGATQAPWCTGIDVSQAGHGD